MYLTDRIHLRRPDDYPVADQHSVQHEPEAAGAADHHVLPVEPLLRGKHVVAVLRGAVQHACLTHATDALPDEASGEDANPL